MITSRTAKVIMYVVTGIWAFNVIMNAAGVMHSPPLLSGLFVAIIAGAVGLRAALPTPAVSANADPIQQVGKFQDWWERKFLPEKYRARLRREIDWYEHELNTPSHLLKDCPFCPTPPDPDKSFEEQLLDSGGVVPIVLSNTSDGASATNLYSVSANPPMVPQSAHPDFTAEELKEIYEYVENSPFMSWEEGDEITEKNMSGMICVTYQALPTVRCMICSNRQPHHHKTEDEERVQKVLQSAVCKTCGESGIHTHDYPSALLLDEPEYDIVQG